MVSMDIYGGFHSHGGTPNGWFIMEQPIKMDDNWGTPISGHLHIGNILEIYWKYTEIYGHLLGKLLLNTTAKNQRFFWMSTFILGRPASSSCGTVPHCKHCRRLGAQSEQFLPVKKMMLAPVFPTFSHHFPYFPLFSNVFHPLWFLPKSVSQDELLHLGTQACGGPAIVGKLSFGIDTIPRW